MRPSILCEYVAVAPAFQSPFRRNSQPAPADSSAEVSADDDIVDDDIVDDDIVDDDTVDDDIVDDDIVDDASGEWLAYELHTWASQTRTMLAQLLLADKVVHSWQGTTLLAHESLEEQVDALLEEAQAAENLELESDKSQVGFEMEGWSGELQALLAERLGVAGVPHGFDAEGDLVCHEEDEDRVELVIEDLLAHSADDGLEVLEGLQANELLSAMFEAVNKLRRDVHDGSAVRRAVEHGHRLAGVATPFGFSGPAFALIRERCGEFADLLQSETASAEDITDLASRLRDGLRQVI